MDAKEKQIREIMDKANNLNPKLNDYQADVKIDAEAQAGFLKLPFTINGKYYFKKPDKHRMVVDDAPEMIAKHLGRLGYRPHKLDDFTMSMLADEKIDDRDHWVIRLDKKSESDFRGVTLWVDKETSTIHRQVSNYKDNGKIEVDIKWRKDGEFNVMEEVVAKLEFPKHGGSANVDAKYEKYAFNVGLDDKVFEEAR